MGSGASRHLLLPCFRHSATGGGGGGDNAADFEAAPLDDETLGHSFRYVRSSTPSHSRSSSAFRSISGAAVSANSSASVPVFDPPATARSLRPHFLASASFLSGPIDRRLENSAESSAAVSFSGPLFSKPRRRWKPSLLRRSFSERNRPWVVPLRSLPSRPLDPDLAAAGNVQWAHGKAGEDRAHVAVSEDHRWLFVGIYDGFNGPEAPEFLVANLYPSLFNELRGLFWEEEEEEVVVTEETATFWEDPKPSRRLREFLQEVEEEPGSEFSVSGRFARYGFGSLRRDRSSRNWLPRWRYDSDSDEKAKAAREFPAGGSRIRRKLGPVADHESVLRALSRALESVELAYLEMTDRAMGCNPELALMGSCLLVVLMRDDDVYVMNVGDSRAIVAQYRAREVPVCRKDGEVDDDEDDDGVKELGNGTEGNGDGADIEIQGKETMELGALQLSTDHSTSIEEEVLRIKEEHPDDKRCIVNDRVKGRLNVTRAFGAGFLKQPKWNNSLLEMFRNEFIGTAPYISCSPSLCHRKLDPNDQFLVLSSDGLYQYLSNEEVVLHVANFLEKFPDGDPAQSLIEELLSRAAKKAGMNFHELMDIPQGDRRKYHDDVTIIIVSLEGRIWKSSG